MSNFKVPELLPPKDKKDSVPETELKIESKSASPKDVEIPYKEPKWSAKPPNEEIVYKFEVLKSGQIIEEHDNLQKKPFWIFGRLPQNDILMEHPTISRFHTVLQYRPKAVSEDSEEDSISSENSKSSPEEGWYVYDLGSTHGTFINKQRIPPKVYIRIRVGHMLTLGLSTRKLIFYGPEEDSEPESELTVTELKERRIQEIEAQKQQEKMQAEEKEREGITWGMAEDAEEESDLSVNPYAVTTNEELFLDDPKKTLRGYFEREGHELEYKCDEISPGNFECKVELPLDDGNGRPIVALVSHKGKKKECVVQCALEACRILDRHGVLRQSHHEPQKRRANEWKDDSDDDDFFDRTILQKKQRLAETKTEKVLSNENLQGELDKILEKIKDIDKEIAEYNEKAKEFKANKDKLKDGDLDEFMDNLNAEVADFDSNKIRVLRKQKFECMEQKKFFERAIKKTGGPSLINKFGLKKTKPVLPIKVPEIQKEKEEEFKPEVESDDDEKVDPIEKPSQQEESTVQLKEIKPVSENISEQIEMEKEEKELPEEKEENIPEEVSLQNEPLKNTDEIASKEIPVEIVKENLTPSDPKKDLEKVSPKKASKPRRNKKSKSRNDVDMDDVEERDDQYVGWVPPQNQSGDGRSSLNDKYGY